MSRFIRKISIWNERTEHYEFTNDFDEAIEICEIAYDFNDSEWNAVKRSSDFYALKKFLITKGIEVETDIDKEIKYLS